MKKKRFYDNKGRGEKWTEQPTGRKIYFADKYVAGNETSTQTDKSKKTKKPFFTKDRAEKTLRSFIIICGCLIIVGFGYTVMDIHLERNAMPYDNAGNDDAAGIGSIDINVTGAVCEPISLDGGVMLSAVIDDLSSGGYTSVAFDIKRSDGTIGYRSDLAAVDLYGAISSPSEDLTGSAKLLKDNDILPIGIISCYKDNVVPDKDLTLAYMKGTSVYKDAAGNTYLNPQADGTYSYIKGIIEEAMNSGISVFVLDNFTIPNSEYSAQSGYDELASRLYRDFGSDLRLFRSIGVSISSENAQAIAREWEEKTADANAENAVFCITAKNAEGVKQLLDDRGLKNYIIFE